MTDAQIFQVFGISLFTLGVAWLSNPKGFQYFLKDLSSNSGILFLTGLMTFVVGYLMVAVYITTSLWVIILGWVTLLKGLVILLFSAAHVAFYPFFARLKIYYALVPWMVFIVGLVALYLGFLA